MSKFATARETKGADTELEFKDAGGDLEIKDAVAELTETTTAAITKIAGEVKANADYLATLEAKMGRPGAAANDNGKPLESEHKAIATFVRTGNDAELKTMSIGSDPDGGYVTTPALADAIMNKMRDQSPMRQLAQVVQIGEGDAYEVPLEASDDIGATWVGETESRPATDTPQLELLRIPVDEIYANQPVTQRLIDDARFDVGAWVTGKIIDKFARAEGTACVSGDGNKKPKGFLSYTTSTDADATRAKATVQHVVSGGAESITADAIRDMFWTLRAPHRANASWLMSSATANAIDKLKASTSGEYLWRDSMAAGVPPMLLGKPVYFSEDMPAVAAGAFPIAFADWTQGYIIATKLGVRLLRDPYTSKPNVLVYGYLRTGGAVANTDAIKVMKVAASA